MDRRSAAAPIRAAQDGSVRAPLLVSSCLAQMRHTRRELWSLGLFSAVAGLGACTTSSSGDDDGGTDAVSTTGDATTDSGAMTTTTSATTTSMTSATSSEPTSASSGVDETTDTATDDTTGDPPLPEEAIAVAVGYGTRRVRSEDGVVWTDFVEVDPAGGDDNNLLRGVGYGGGTFVAVGGATEALVLTSPDGVRWQTVAAGIGAFLSDVVWQDELFVAAGGNGARALSSDGGATWSSTAEYYAGHFREIAVGNGVFVAAGHTYGDSMIGMWSTSTDGASWSEEQTGGAPVQSGGLAFGSGTFVIRDAAGALSFSSDGASWTPASTELAGPGSVLYAEGEFLTAGEDGLWRSSDGATWRMVGASNGRGVIAFIDGQYLSLGWPLAIAASTDLAQWQTVFMHDGPGLTDVAVGVPGT
jgi:hypothetical protein